MLANVIRIQCLSLNDAGGEPFRNVLLYIKKLTSASTSDGSSTQLEEKDPGSSTVSSFNETYDLSLDDEFVQILFLQADDEANILGDIVLYRPYLFSLLECWTKTHGFQKKLMTNASLDQKYTLTFCLLFIEDFVRINPTSPKSPKSQTVRDHSMVITQFNEVVYCAICTKFILGFRNQGYKCRYCSIVTDKKCHKRIPFRCQKSPNPRASSCNENGAREFRLQHALKPYNPPFYQIQIPCKNCGAHVSRNALKCTRCKFIIHAECQASVPSMCGVSYEVQAKMLEEKCDSSSDESTESDASDDADLPWLDPLPKDGLNHLPKFSDFEYIGHLGSGGYSNVYCARHISSQGYVAIKVVDGKIESAREQFEIERQILFRYSQGSPYMIKGYCSFHEGSTLFLVMEIVGDDTLMQKMQRRPLNETDIRYYLAEIISVIEYLHRNKVVYRDLKLEHILVCAEGHIRLVDYGLGRILNTPDEICHTICGTPGYVSPEVRRLARQSSADGYSYPVDYWAIGKMFVEMICGEAFSSQDEENELSNIAENLPTYRHISQEARSLARGLLEIDPKKRLGSVTSPHGFIRDHPFFRAGKVINWEEINDGVYKSSNKKELHRVDSDMSINFPFPITSLDRGSYRKRDWINAGESKCESHEEQLFKSFDYVNLSAWSKFIKSN